MANTATLAPDCLLLTGPEDSQPHAFISESGPVLPAPRLSASVAQLPPDHTLLGAPGILADGRSQALAYAAERATRSPSDWARCVVERLYAEVVPETLRAYRKGLEAFAKFVGAVDAEAASLLLISAGQGGANELVDRYVQHLQAARKENGEPFSPSTIRQRLAALRKVVAISDRIGWINWTLNVDAPDDQPYRNTHGIGHESIMAMLKSAAAGSTLIDVRDAAMLACEYSNGLRVNELCSLDLSNYEPHHADGPSLWVLRKRKKLRVRRDLVSIDYEADGNEVVNVQAMLDDWIEVRGHWPGPMFVSFDINRKMTRRRLKTNGWNSYILKKIARRGGVRGRVHSHAIRHTYGTEVARITGGNVYEVAEAMGHEDLNTTTIYVRNAKGTQRKLSTQLMGGRSAK